MAKKLILLVLLVPIIVMACLFAATRSISNLIDLPVSGIEIVDTSAHIYLNLDQAETYELAYAVYPTNAKNKTVIATAEPIEGETFAELEFTQAGSSAVTLVPKTAGSAKVYLTTADGGFKDSVIVHVESPALKSLDASLTKDTIAVGETVSILTSFNPTAPSNTVCHYATSNPRVATVDENGRVRAVGKGTATITVTSNYNPDIFDLLTVNVFNTDVMDLGISEIVTHGKYGTIPISMDTETVFSPDNFTVEIFDSEGNPLPDGILTAEITVTDGAYAVSYVFSDESFLGDISIKITYRDALDTVEKVCDISRVRDLTLTFEEGTVSLYTGQQIPVPFYLTPTDAEVSYRVSVSNPNVTATMVGSRLILTGAQAGIATLTLTVTSTASADITKTASIPIAILPQGFSINEAANTYGIENILTIGGLEYDYTSSPSGVLVKAEQSPEKYSLTYSILGPFGEGFRENVSWVTDNDAVKIDRNGAFKILDPEFYGTVNVSARFSFGGKEALTAPFAIRIVADAVNVFSYRDLYYATEAGHRVVLFNHIKDDFGYIDGAVKYSEMHTTYDDTYYDNTGKTDLARVKVLINFKNDVFGNGFSINAHNLTYDLDASGLLSKDAFFRGPLEFVAMLETASSISVKAQDNIAFAVYEGVSVNNVTLESCTLTPDKDGKIDLIDLTYVGTTLEVLGDNVDIRYCRLNNGRTTLRAFGDVNDPTKVIHVNISNSVLSGAREFLLRIGSNCFVDGTVTAPSPTLEGDSGNAHTVKERYQEMTEAERAAYDESFIKTFVTVKNSVFKDAGLFAIGVDSHFSGQALADGRALVDAIPALQSLFMRPDGTSLIDDWKNLAKTSYGAKLSFEGEVNLYNWKNLEDVDSRSLIEVPENSAFSGKIDFDVQEMLLSLSDKSGYTEILHKEGENTYVHAGIAFFGGGKNYGVFEAETGNTHTLSRYKVSLQSVNKAYFMYAAGDESFYFFMYNSASSFTYADQQTRLATGDEAYSCIYKK